MSSGSQSKACCTLPPVKADYTPTGSYTTIADLKTYVVGPEDSKKAILIIYDIFGIKPQITQGADLLAGAGYRVIMPDFLKGEWATPSMFDGSAEGNAAKAKFFSGFPGAIGTQSRPVADVAAELSKKYEALGVVGYCWGWKVAVESEGIKSFKAIAGCHPSFAAPEDSDKIDVPVCLLPSEDEDMEVMQKIYDAAEQKNKGNNHLHQFKGHPHGFLAARADLSKEADNKAFHKGYTQLAHFFEKHL